MAAKFTLGKRAPMDASEYANQVLALQADAVEYIDGYIAPDRALAQGYYLGDLFGNEEEGRSQIVMTVTRDVVLSIVPEILRIFTASGKLGEFVPNSKRTVEQAAQATDYCNHVFWNDNNGFLILHNAIKDALTVKTGVIKWRWSEDTEVTEAEYTKISRLQLMKLTEDGETEILSAEPSFDPQHTKAEVNYSPGHENDRCRNCVHFLGGKCEEVKGDIDPEYWCELFMPGQAMPTFDVHIRRKRKKQRVVLEGLPPEEFIVHRETRDLDSTIYAGHRSLKTKSDLVAMGYDREEIENLTASDDSLYMTNIEAQTRNPAINLFSNDTGPNDAAKRVLYVEQFVRIDKDGDGIAELRKVCSVGNHILHDEVADSVHFAELCPDPTPHMLIGQSIADQTMDLQLIISAIVRDVLDSLKQSINPRTVVVEGQVNIDDVLNNEVGGIIRARAPGMVTPLDTPFVGQQALPILGYMDAVKQRRTGINDASQGLDPDVLQSTTKDAVTATIQGAQARIEMIARIFAEGGIKRLMKGILKMVIRHQDKPRIIRLRDQFVEMDPRFWDSDLDVQTNVALGRGTDQDKLRGLLLIKQTQEQILQILGPANPLSDISKYRETLAEIAHLMGFKDESKFFGEVDPKVVEQAMAASQNKGPDQVAMLAQIEAKKVELTAQKNQMDAEQKRQEMELNHQFEMFKARLDAFTRLAVEQIKLTGSFDEANLEAAVAQNEAVIKADTERYRAEVNAAAQQNAARINAENRVTNG